MPEEVKREVRTSNDLLTIVNTCKCYFGIAILAGASFIQQGGIYTSILVVVIITLMNNYSTFLLIKARNRFKNRQISTLADMADLLYGSWAVGALATIQILGIVIFLFAYSQFFGRQID